MYIAHVRTHTTQSYFSMIRNVERFNITKTEKHQEFTDLQCGLTACGEGLVKQIIHLGDKNTGWIY